MILYLKQQHKTIYDSNIRAYPKSHISKRVSIPIIVVLLLLLLWLYLLEFNLGQYVPS